MSVISCAKIQFNQIKTKSKVDPVTLLLPEKLHFFYFFFPFFCSILLFRAFGRAYLLFPLSFQKASDLIYREDTVRQMSSCWTSKLFIHWCVRTPLVSALAKSIGIAVNTQHLTCLRKLKNTNNK